MIFFIVSSGPIRATYETKLPRFRIQGKREERNLRRAKGRVSSFISPSSKDREVINKERIEQSSQHFEFIEIKMNKYYVSPAPTVIQGYEFSYPSAQYFKKILLSLVFECSPKMRKLKKKGHSFDQDENRNQWWVKLRSQIFWKSYSIGNWKKSKFSVKNVFTLNLEYQKYEYLLVC